MDYRIVPGRYFASMRLAAVLPDRVVIEWDQLDEHQPPAPRYIMVGLEPFQLRQTRMQFDPREWTNAPLDERIADFETLLHHRDREVDEAPLVSLARE